MRTLYHLAEESDWAGAQAAGSYVTSTRGVPLAEQGFIHCSLQHQVQGVADLLFAGVDGVVLLVIDAERLAAPVRYEASEPGGEEYPHVYGPLLVAAVVEAIRLTRDHDGRWLLPL